MILKLLRLKFIGSGIGALMLLGGWYLIYAPLGLAQEQTVKISQADNQQRVVNLINLLSSSDSYVRSNAASTLSRSK